MLYHKKYLLAGNLFSEYNATAVDILFTVLTYNYLKHHVTFQDVLRI